jgi:hypothetical protein
LGEGKVNPLIASVHWLYSSNHHLLTDGLLAAGYLLFMMSTI